MESDSEKPAVRFDCVATGARMDWAVPRALFEGGQLASLHVDANVPSRFTRLAQSGILGRRMRNGIVRGIPDDLIRRHSGLFALRRLRRRAPGKLESILDVALRAELRSIARRCTSAYVFGTQSTSVELFVDREIRILEQFSPPIQLEKELLAKEQAAWPGWMSGVSSSARRWDDRTIEEWELANLIWTPSGHVASGCVALGAEPSKMKVVPYPVPELQHERPELSGQHRDRLRVTFAGPIDLYKGVQYIYKALHGWREARFLDVHLYGPPRLTCAAMSKLAEIGTLHGAVPRSALLEAFVQSDILLFPSLSEGTALVTLEATAVGLPVVATRESGAPESAFYIPARDASAIRNTLNRLLDDREMLEHLSGQTVTVRSVRSQAHFAEDILRLANTNQVT